MRPASPFLHVTIWLSIAAFSAILILALTFKVEIVARGSGRVVPEMRSQIIQPEFDGRVTKIHVRNGDRVDLGAKLITLDATDARVALAEIENETARLAVEQVRLVSLIAALDANDPEQPGFGLDALARFDAACRKTCGFAIQEHRALLRAETADISTSLHQMAANVAANRTSQSVTQADIARVDAALEIEAERLAISERLQGSGTISYAALLDGRAAHTTLLKEREVLERELDQKHDSAEALALERITYLSGRRSDAYQRLAEVAARLNQLAQNTLAAERHVDGMVLRAPVAGSVDSLSIHTEGAVITAADTIMRIVPADAKVEIEASVGNEDVGFLVPGQTVNIRLDAFPSERFGMATGTLSHVSADAVERGDGTWGFVARIVPDAPAIEDGTNRYALKPGMTGQIDIVTGRRRLMSYFFAPIVATISRSLGER